jgi:hypothetical protein
MSSKDQSGIEKVGGAVLFGLFVSMILKNTLDSFFKGLTQVADFSQLWINFQIEPVKTSLFWFQLIVFLFTLSRFALGAARYFQQSDNPKTGGVYAFDFCGVILVFGAFYTTSFLIRTTVAFYFSFLVIHFIDCAAFLFASSFLGLPEETQRIARRFAFFDFISLFVLLFPVLFRETPHYWLQFLVLCGVTVIGIYELRSLWRFYTTQSEPLDHRAQVKG